MTRRASRMSAVWPTLALMAGALALRSLMLSKESLWMDEASSWDIVSGGWRRALEAERTNPPLYYLLLRFWMLLFGSSEAALRSLSIVPGVLSVALVIAVGRRVFSREVGLGAGLYLAISSFHVYYSQEARAFALLTSFILLSTLFLLNALEGNSSRARLVNFAGYAVTTALSLYTHFIAVFYLAAQFVYVTVRGRRSRQVVSGYIVAAGAAVLAYLPWLLPMLTEATGRGQFRRYLALKVPQALWSFLFGDTLVPLDERAVRDIAGTLASYWPFLAAGIAASAVLLPFVLAAFRRWKQGAALTMIMVFVPILLALLLSLRTPMFDERYLIGSSPFLYLAVAAGAQEVVRSYGSANRRAATVAGIAGLGGYILLSSLSLYNYFFNPRFGREQWREAVSELEARSDREDLVLIDPDHLAACYRYYQKRGLECWAMTPGRVRQLVAGEAELNRRLAERRRVWLMRSHTYDERLLSWLRARFRQTEARFYPKAKGIEVFGFSR